MSQRLVALRNDLGLLSDEYDVEHQRQVGNFAQAFSHLTLIIAARAISVAEGRSAGRRAWRAPDAPQRESTSPIAAAWATASDRDRASSLR